MDSRAAEGVLLCRPGWIRAPLRGGGGRRTLLTLAIPRAGDWRWAINWIGSLSWVGGLAGWHRWQATWRLWLGASSAACPRRSGLGCELRKSCLPCRARGAQQSQFAAASRICHGDDAILGVLSRRLQVPRERPPSAVGSQKDPDDPSNGFRDAYWTRGCGALSPSRLAGRAGRHQIPRILPDHGPTI
jgi:hypothetical protein